MKLLSKLLAGLAIITFTNTSFAQSWVEVAESATSKFYILSGSVGTGKTDAGDNIFFARGRTVRLDINRTEFAGWYVKISECLRQSGKFVVVNMNGEFQFDTDFKIGDNRISSSLAQIICQVGMEQLIPSNPKQPRV